MAEDALNRTIETNRTITGIEEGLQVASDSIIQTRRNVIEASEALDIAESKCKWAKTITVSDCAISLLVRL